MLLNGRIVRRDVRAAGIRFSSPQSYMQRLLGLYGVDRYSPKSLSRRWIPSHHGSLRRKRSTVTAWENVTISHFVTKVTLRAAGCGARPLGAFSVTFIAVANTGTCSQCARSSVVKVASSPPGRTPITPNSTRVFQGPDSPICHCGGNLITSRARIRSPRCLTRSAEVQYQRSIGWSAHVASYRIRL